MRLVPFLRISMTLSVQNKILEGCEGGVEPCPCLAAPAQYDACENERGYQKNKHHDYCP